VTRPGKGSTKNGLQNIPQPSWKTRLRAQLGARGMAGDLTQRGAFTLDWDEVTGRYHERTFRHECRRSSLPAEWQRELAALWRLEADVNNGAYLQFLGNWGRECYVYASQALKKIGAVQMAQIIDRCQALVDEHFASVNKSHDQLREMMHNP